MLVVAHVVMSGSPVSTLSSTTTVYQRSTSTRVRCVSPPPQQSMLLKSMLGAWGSGTSKNPQIMSSSAPLLVVSLVSDTCNSLVRQADLPPKSIMMRALHVFGIDSNGSRPSIFVRDHILCPCTITELMYAQISVCSADIPPNNTLRGCAMVQGSSTSTRTHIGQPIGCTAEGYQYPGEHLLVLWIDEQHCGRAVPVCTLGGIRGAHQLYQRTDASFRRGTVSKHS